MHEGGGGLPEMTKKNMLLTYFSDNMITYIARGRTGMGASDDKKMKGMLKSPTY